MSLVSRCVAQRCLVLVLVCAVLVTVFTPATIASWTTATVRTPASAKPGSLSMTYTSAGVTCVAAPVTSCASQSMPAASASQGPSSVAATLTNGGSWAVAYSQSVQFTDCRPLKFDNAINSNGFLIARGGITRQVTDKWGTRSAARFDGVNDSISGLAPAPTGTFGNGSWSMGIWLKAAPGSLGTSLLGASVNPQTPGPRGGAPVLRLLNDGRVRVELFGTLGSLVGATWNAPSLRDDRWHFVVISLVKGLLSSQLVLYIDGVAQTSNNVSSLLTATTESYKWHIGWVDASTSAFPNNSNFTGDLSGAFFKASAMTPAEAQALFQSSTASAYQNALTAQGASDIWMLGDTKANRFLGSLPYVDAPGDPCYFLLTSVLTNGVAIVSTVRISDLVTASSGGTVWSSGQPAPGPGGTANIANWVSRSSPFDVDVSNLELQVTYSHRLTANGTNWSAITRLEAVNLVA